MRYTLTALIVAMGILAGTGTVIAHHGAATFDTGKKLTMEGTVTEWVWSNPHCFLKFDVTEKDGTVRHWTVETSNPPDMVNRGWSRRSFKGGEKVTVVVEPVKSGNPVGRLLNVTFADGKVLSTQG
ncbi:MAG TPA: DUF6152 family protein [Vicinamibacterales bacterium]|nr:DUF6152 family protein [Vicinamibacterales bacterium]